jgi:Zn finger protein HypA/HybF involved in hydrogenase expression
LWKAIDEEGVLRNLKEGCGEDYSGSQTSGAVFWFAVADFFPAEAQLQQLPDFSSVPNLEILEYPPWENDSITAMIEGYEADLARVTSKVTSFKVPELQDRNVRIEESAILAEVKMLDLRPGLEEYLAYFEKSFKESPLLEGKSSKGNSSMRKGVKPEDDCMCEVCGDGDYDEDDLIVICSVMSKQKCDKGFHMHCYGIPEVPEGDWICDMCREFSSPMENPPCALCTVRVGAMKPTVHSAFGSTFPNYSSCQSVAKVWVHVFCARQIVGVTVTDSAHFSGIDLSRIAQTRFKIECEVCNSKCGACLQCSYKKCRVSYHAECGKPQFIETRARSEIEEVKIYCNQHKPSKLRRQLAVKEKKHIDEVLNFSKTFEEQCRLEDPRKKRKRVQDIVPRLELPFSMQEDIQLEDKLEQALRAIRKQCSKKFTVSFRLNSKSKRGQACVDQPRYYTLIAPEAILNDKVRIDGRSVDETFAHYKEKQYPRLKKELNASNLPLTVFRKRLLKYIKADGKRKRKAKSQSLLKYALPSTMVLTPQPTTVVSEELYCICRRPYIEKVTADPFVTEEEFKAQQTDNTMMECDQCHDWFHWGCMRVLGYNPRLLSEEEVEFVCPNCNKKKPKLDEDNSMSVDEPVLS